MQITVREAAKILSVSEKTIYRWIEEGNIPAYRLNDRYRFHRAELLEWATARKIGVSSEILKEEYVAVPTLSSALQTGGIFYRLNGNNKERVLKAVVENVHLPDGVDREMLLQVIIAREKLASTGIGDGIAIPHARNPIVLHVEKPIVTLCFLEKPVDFGALDGKPVECLFTLVSPTVRAHLLLLSRLVFALHNSEFKSVIKRQGLREEIISTLKKAEASFAAPPAENGTS